MPETKKEEQPVEKATIRSSGNIKCQTLQRHDDWSLIRDLNTGDCRVVGESLYPEGVKVLPAKFDMSTSDWGKTIVPVDVAKAIGLSGEYAIQFNTALWRKGRVRKDQPITRAMIDYAVNRIHRVVSDNVERVQPDPE